MLGSFVNWGTPLHISNKSALQWIDATTMHIALASIISIMSSFAIESPRWLYSVAKQDLAAVNMSKLCQLPAEHPYVRVKLIDINDQLGREQEAARVPASLSLLGNCS